MPRLLRVQDETVFIDAIGFSVTKPESWSWVDVDSPNPYRSDLLGTPEQEARMERGILFSIRRTGTDAEVDVSMLPASMAPNASTVVASLLVGMKDDSRFQVEQWPKPCKVGGVSGYCGESVATFDTRIRWRIAVVRRGDYWLQLDLRLPESADAHMLDEMKALEQSISLKKPKRGANATRPTRASRQGD